MVAETEPTLDPPTCSRCQTEMTFRARGTQKTIPVIGSDIEYQQFGCTECGQGARFERRTPDEEWTRTGL